MTPIITHRDTALTKGMLSSGRYFIEKHSGTAMYLPIWYGHRLDLRNMTITENSAEIDARTDLPDLNQLVKQGYLLEATIYREHDIYPKGYPHCDCRRKLQDAEIETIIAEFKEHGFDVTKEAILHNYYAWIGDLKSGFRDAENGYHLFSPCGCNPLSFRASSLEDELNWQDTYSC